MKDCSCTQCAEFLMNPVEHYPCPRCKRFGTLDEFSEDHEECLECLEATNATADA